MGFIISYTVSVTVNNKLMIKTEVTVYFIIVT